MPAQLSFSTWRVNHYDLQIQHIEAVELTSQQHEPMSVQASARRESAGHGTGGGEKLVVQIDDVVSPSIILRLDLQEGLFRAHIPDWRAVVDYVLIDTNQDGEVFNFALADVPTRKQDLVIGSYELSAPPIGATVAIKVIDVLGEERVLHLTV